ncbi:1-aminocyclopropane-1-carboxylate oxidase homolog 1-like [Nymphaea colorata]|nr:1-aminocyclopropane-1-carboxylate oxidase homolog 1-like [Nymphaea colorata]
MSFPSVVPSRNIPSDLEIEEAIKAFDESKAGVKGLVDSRIATVPSIFIEPPESNRRHNRSECTDPDQSYEHVVPVIDLSGPREDIVVQICEASEKWGVFQAVNHGVPLTILDEMLLEVAKFHESPAEEKQQFYTRDLKKKVGLASTFDLYTRKRANWRDTVHCDMAPDPPSPEELPMPWREILPEYSKRTAELGGSLMELLAEALGLPSNVLIDMECMKAQTLALHYYPPCPQPELTVGATKHSDPSFITILLQDHIGGLQVLHQDHWIDVVPFHGALVVNVGDLLQLVSNDKFLSVEHRVLASRMGPRVSVACFLKAALEPGTNKFGPIKDLLSDDNPAKYMEVSMIDYTSQYNTKGLDGVSALNRLKLR